MDRTTKDKIPQPLGVIACLKTGFDVVGRHIWLIALPVLLDLFLWFGPRLSIAPIINQVTQALTRELVTDPGTASDLTQAIEALRELGEGFNLFSLLSTAPLLNVPSLVARLMPGVGSPLGEQNVLVAQNIGAPILWIVVLLPLGLALGFLYLNTITHSLRTAGSAGLQKGTTNSPTVVKFVRLGLFTGSLLIGTAIAGPPVLLLIGLAGAIAQPLGMLAWVFALGAVNYLLIHILFAIPSLILGERGLLRALQESIVITRTQLPAVVGLLLLVILVHEGFNFVWTLPSSESWSLLIGIVGNGCVATGLTAGVFIFYQDRIQVLLSRQRAAQESNSN